MSALVIALVVSNAVWIFVYVNQVLAARTWKKVAATWQDTAAKWRESYFLARSNAAHASRSAGRSTPAARFDRESK